MQLGSILSCKRKVAIAESCIQNLESTSEIRYLKPFPYLFMIRA